jgi:hypothetical protein
MPNQPSGFAPAAFLCVFSTRRIARCSSHLDATRAERGQALLGYSFLKHRIEENDHGKS